MTLTRETAAESPEVATPPLESHLPRTDRRVSNQVHLIGMSKTTPRRAMADRKLLMRPRNRELSNSLAVCVEPVGRERACVRPQCGPLP